MCLPAGWVQVALTHVRGEASLRGPLGGAASSLDATSSEPASKRRFFVRGVFPLMHGLSSLHS